MSIVLVVLYVHVYDVVDVESAHRYFVRVLGQINIS